MAWTAPRTWVTAEVVSASNLNTHVRDNFLSTAPGKLTSVDEIAVSTAANIVEARSVQGDGEATSETTTSTAYTDLATVGPAVSLFTSTRAFVSVSAFESNNTAGASSFMGFAITDSSTVSASDGNSVQYESGAANDGVRHGAFYFVSALTGGSNTFTAKYRVSSGTGTFSSRHIIVFPL